MTPRQTEHHRLWGLDVEGKRRMLPLWSKTERGRHFIFNHLDPLAVKLGVDRESLRGWYHECLLRGVHLVYDDGHSRAAEAAYWASVEAASQRAASAAAFQERWRELATREQIRMERQLGSDSTLHVLFLQLRSGELGSWWPRFVRGSTDPAEPAGPLVAGMLRSMYGIYQLAWSYDYVKWLAPQRSFVPTFQLPPGVRLTGHDELSLMSALSADYAPLPWEQNWTRRQPPKSERTRVRELAERRMRMEDRIADRADGHDAEDGGA